MNSEIGYLKINSWRRKKKRMKKMNRKLNIVLKQEVLGLFRFIKNMRMSKGEENAKACVKK
jgi:hypothetical protein